MHRILLKACVIRLRLSMMTSRCQLDRNLRIRGCLELLDARVFVVRKLFHPTALA